MLGALHYAAANAAVRAGISRFLTSQHWQRLLSVPSLDEMTPILQQTPLGDVLTRSADSLAEMERQFRRYVAENSRKPLKFLGGSVRSLLDCHWRRFEVENINIVLRGVHNRKPAAAIRQVLIPMDDISEIDWPTLAGVSSIRDLVERLTGAAHGGDLADPLEEALAEYERRQDVFVLENALDLAFWRQLRRQIQSLAGSDRRNAEKFIGFRIDSQNFLAACRYRLYFGLSPEDIVGSTQPYGKTVNAETIQEIAVGAPAAEMAAKIWPDLRGLNRLDRRSERDGLIALEVMLARHVHRIARGALAADPLRLSTLLAFDVLLEHEVADLIAVIEGKAVGRSLDAITADLIGFRGPS